MDGLKKAHWKKAGIAGPDFIDWNAKHKKRKEREKRAAAKLAENIRKGLVKA